MKNIKNSHIVKDPVVRYFSQRIREDIGNHVEEIILFGSRARGDATPGSDYDSVGVPDDKSGDRAAGIRGIEVEILNRFDVPAGCIIWNHEEWNRKKRFSIGRNILVEGILL